MVPIHTKPPSRDYDDGWDRIFGKKKEADHIHELGSCSYCDRRLALKELTRLSEEYGGYRSETDPIVSSSTRPEAVTENVADADGSPADTDGPSTVAAADVSVSDTAETEQHQDGHTKLPGGGLRHPRGCMCHIKR